MKLADQLVSPDLSKKLHDLGVKNDSLYKWSRWIPPKGATYSDDSIAWKLMRGCTSSIYEIVPAYTVAEILELLPSRIGNASFEIIKLPISFDGDTHVFGYEVRYRTPQFQTDHIQYRYLHGERGKNLANAAAKMRIWIIEQGHVKV